MAMTATTPPIRRTVYQYCNPDGTPYCKVTREDYAPGTGPNGKDKKFSIYPEGLEGPHPLYRAERLAALPTTTNIFIVEGEKCVHVLEAVGLVAVTSKGGSKSANKTDWSPLAKFRHACILPDNDEPGREYARDVVGILADLPGQREAVVVELPWLAAAEDVADYLVDHDAADLLAAIEEHGRPAKVNGITVDDWPEPKQVMSVSSVVLPVRAEMLPESIGAWCFDAADRMQAPADYVAVSAIISMGSLIGRQLCIRPKARDSWAVVPNVWGAIVGPPAAMKTPCLKEARRFLDKLDREAQVEYDMALEKYSREYITYEVWDKTLKAKAAKAHTKEAQARILEEMEEPPESPVRVRKYTQDTTVEKLQDLLTKNPNGMLMLRDELVGFLRGLDKPGQEGSRAFFLESWEGNGRFLVDRISRGSTCIDGACLAVLGGTTPGGVSEYVVDAMGNGTGNDGLLQRFSLVAYPDITPDFTYTDRMPDDQASTLAEKAFNRCYEIDTDSIGADCYPDSLPFMRYDRTAQSYFADWYTDLMVRCRRDDEHPALLSHLNKFTKLVPAMSLIFHVCNGETGPVGQVPLLQAMAWAEYAKSHARKLYEGAFRDVAVTATTVLMRHIEYGDLEDNFSSRDVSRKCWTGLTCQEHVQAALDELLDAGYLRRHTDKKIDGGRPTYRYMIHPKYRSTRYGQVD